MGLRHGRRRLRFKVRVSDEGHFWENRDLAELAKNVGEYDALIAGLAGAFKDSASATGLGFDSPMLGRPDFEKLEMESTKIPNVAEFLKAFGVATAVKE
ncbi:MAG: hypothetical protein ACYC35_22355 [Pirellulales bacterium]